MLILGVDLIGLQVYDYVIIFKQIKNMNPDRYYRTAMTSTLSQYHDSSNLMPKVLTYLDAAYGHICRAKKEAHSNHDTWSIRFHWDQEKQSLCKKLLAGSYYFSASKAYKVGNHSISVWRSLDSVVTTALSLFLQDWLYPKIGVIDQCYHLKGKGVKAAVKTVRQLTKKYTYTFKTDIKSYYASIERHLVQAIFSRWIKDRRIPAYYGNTVIASRMSMAVW